MKKIATNLLLLFITVLLFLCIAEVVLRLFKMVPLAVVNESIYPNTLGDYKPSQKLWSDYRLSYRVTVNSLGLRGKEINIKKTEGVYRIMVLGDSFVFGERVSDEDCFPYQLEQLLNGTDTLSRFEVINAGHSAYTTREEYEYLLEKGLKLAPDMIILGWFPNDISELSRQYSWRDLLKVHYKFEPYKSYLRRFAVFNAARPIITNGFTKLKFGRFVPRDDVNIFDEQETDAERSLWSSCFDHILKIKDICDKNKIRFLLAAFPDYSQFGDKPRFGPQEKLRRFAEAQKIDFIDIAETFMAQGEDISSFYLLPVDPHFSALGNSVAAGGVCVYLKRTDGR